MRRPWIRGLLVLALTTGCLIFSGSVTSLARFTSSQARANALAAGTLSAPTVTAASGGGGTAIVTWTAVTTSGSGTVMYYVQRDGGNPGGNCPTSAAPTTVLTCTDTGLAAGTHSYTVTSVYYSWTATSAPATFTIAGPPTMVFTSSGNPNGYLTDNLQMTNFPPNDNITLTYAFGSPAWMWFGSVTTDGSGSGAETFTDIENCVDGSNVQQTTDLPVTINATDGTNTWNGVAGTVLCSLWHP